MGRSGVSQERLNAIDTCREKGWVPGTTLYSSEWKTLREVQEIGMQFVRMKHRPNRGSEKVTTFPHDVKPFDEALETIRRQYGGGGLDSFVHESKAMEASVLNNKGVEAQVEYLVGALGMEWVKKNLLEGS